MCKYNGDQTVHKDPKKTTVLTHNHLQQLFSGSSNIIINKTDVQSLLKGSGQTNCKISNRKKCQMNDRGYKKLNGADNSKLPTLKIIHEIKFQYYYTIISF